MATDQEIRDAGLLYIPKQKYLQNPYNLPVAPPPTEPVPGGITNTNAFNSGNDDFSVYNPDPNSIVNKNYNPYNFRNAAENTFLPGGSNYKKQVFNPKQLDGAKFKDDRIVGQKIGYNKAGLPFINAGSAIGQQANNLYKLSEKDLNDPFNRLATSSAFPGMQAVDVKDIANKALMDYRQNYGANTQYEKDNYYDTVDNPLAYSGQTELEKMKESYPGYFAPKPLEGIPGAISNYAKNSLMGKGLGIAKGVLEKFFPNNMQAKLVNELGGKGFMVNNIGQIVSGGGDYDTAGNVMSGYNTSKMTAKTFDDRIKSLGNMTDAGKEKRTKAILEAKKNFLDAQKKAGVVFEDEEEKKKKKKKKKTFNFLKKKKTAEAKTTTGTTGTAGTAGTTTGTAGNNTTSTTTGGGTVPTTDPNYTPRGPNQPDPVDNSYDGSKNDRPDDKQDNDGDRPDNSGGGGFSNPGKGSYGPHFARGGRAGYFFGGRVNYKIGGRVGFKNGGLASIL